MAIQQHGQPLAPSPKHVPRPFDQPHLQAELARKPWLTSREAMIFTDRPTLAAWYAFRDRRGIDTDSAGRVLRRDVQRALDAPRKPRVMHPKSLANLRRSVEVRFWAKVEKTSGCWLWHGCRLPNRYGKFYWPGSTQQNGDATVPTEYAHRVAWILTNSEIPDGLFVLHRCDNRSCVNPAHLFLGTHTDNMVDAMSKGKFGHSVKVSEVGMADIRRRYCRTPSNAAALAAEYHISKTTLWRIVSGRGAHRRTRALRASHPQSR